MTGLKSAIDQILQAQIKTEKPLAIILAGHNGSGQSTLWRKILSPRLELPLLNADRMMLSILPEPSGEGALLEWLAGCAGWRKGLRRTCDGRAGSIRH